MNKVVYLHRNSKGEVFYCGSGTMERSTECTRGGKRARRSPEWFEHAVDGVEVEVIAEGLTSAEALALERITTRQLLDDGAHLVNVFNTPKGRELRQGSNCARFKGLTIGTSTSGSIFVADGEIRLEQYGFNQGNVSRCINGSKGFKSHKGRTWTRITTIDQAIHILMHSRSFDHDSDALLLAFIEENSDVDETIH